MKNLLLSLVVLFFPLASFADIDAGPEQEKYYNGKPVVGRVEKINLVDEDINIDAKLDSGAAMSSLSAKNIIIYKRNNQNWVRFTVSLPATHKEITFDKLLVRSTHILKRAEEYTGNNPSIKQYGKRPVIAMTVCLGDQEETILVNLIDRTNFKYPMLIGSSALKKFDVVVDVGRHYLAPPQCD